MEKFILLGLIVVVMVVIISNIIWNILLGFTWRRIFISFADALFNRNSVADPNAPIDIRRDMLPSEEMKLRAEQLSFDAVVSQNVKPQPPQAVIPPDLFEVTGTTSDSGWPRPLDEETAQNPRGFRNIHIQTDSERVEQANRKNNSES